MLTHSHLTHGQLTESSGLEVGHSLESDGLEQHGLGHVVQTVSHQVAVVLHVPPLARDGHSLYTVGYVRGV